MEWLDGDTLEAFFGDSLKAQFFRTLFLFTAAAWVHGRQVRKEIRNQVGELISVLKQDLKAQKEMLGALTGRVTKIETHLNLKENSDGSDFGTTRPGSQSKGRH